MKRKKGLVTEEALAALAVGVQEQNRRMAEKLARPVQRTKRTQVAIQFTDEALAMFQQAQARLLERGVRKAAIKGEALEVVLREWLEKT